MRRTPLFEKHASARREDGALRGLRDADPVRGASSRSTRGARATPGCSISRTWASSVSRARRRRALDRLVSSDIAGLDVGQARYGLLRNEQRHDRRRRDRLSRRPRTHDVVVNASNIEKDRGARPSRIFRSDVRFDDKSMDTALIALQGPRAAEILSRVAGDRSSAISPFGVTETTRRRRRRSSRAPATPARTASRSSSRTPTPRALWDALLEAGAATASSPIGLGARDTLRLEARLLALRQRHRRDDQPDRGRPRLGRASSTRSSSAARRSRSRRPRARRGSSSASSSSGGVRAPRLSTVAADGKPVGRGDQRHVRADGREEHRAGATSRRDSRRSAPSWPSISRQRVRGEVSRARSTVAHETPMYGDAR